ncbi:tyrosine decarboxylase-like isoform X2 [Schistocerca gregaria]|uniref:tyrosine decarboxylase-like isoform X2 n=1 Tax=Schistocerca gregaria TaxID=7010 RepID=UPI00211E0743|nr:tyrosine decarboxylase-like isoform X2 [Schistocerca gregaria]
MRKSTINDAATYRSGEGMSVHDFKKHGKDLIDYIYQFMQTISSRRVNSDVEPFYLVKLLPDEAPHEPEEWDKIMKDVEDKIMPGVTQWNHPYFFAYFASANSYPGILGDMLSSALACQAFNWFVSPACTELEMVVTDWYGKALGLPKSFLHSSGPKKGGGCAQGSASENIFAAIMAARYQAIKLCLEDKENYNFSDEWDVLKNLVSYTSKAAHSSTEKGAKMACLRLRILDVDEKCSLRGDTLQQAIEKDLQLGLIPCCVVATLGSTGEAAFDNLKEIAMVCRKYPLIWLHVDAAYGGSSFVCREFRYLLSGIEDAHSINVNPNKWFLVNFDCNCIWLKDYQQFIEALSVNPLYLDHEWMDETVNFHDWGTPLSRRFRVLKLWFVMRTYGIKGLQHYIRRHCHLASLFESLVRKDSRFEVMNDVKMSLVCFRLIKLNVEVELTEDEMTELLLAYINSTGELHMVPAHIHDCFSIRFCVVYEHATEEMILLGHSYKTVPHIWRCTLKTRKIIQV